MTDTSTAPTRNPYEALARERKAHRLAAVVRCFGVQTGEHALNLDRTGREAAAGLAGVHPGSQATWQRIAAILDGETDLLDRLQTEVDRLDP